MANASWPQGRKCSWWFGCFFTWQVLKKETFPTEKTLPPMVFGIKLGDYVLTTQWKSSRLTHKVYSVFLHSLTRIVASFSPSQIRWDSKKDISSNFPFLKFLDDFYCRHVYHWKKTSTTWQLWHIVEPFLGGNGELYQVNLIDIYGCFLK